MYAVFATPFNSVKKHSRVKNRRKSRLFHRLPVIVCHHIRQTELSVVSPVTSGREVNADREQNMAVTAFSRTISTTSVGASRT